MIKEYLKQSILVTDGAMGTYYSTLIEQNDTVSELANIENKDIITRIHNEYIEAGANLIRTNTFAANTYSLECSREVLKDIIVEGYKIAVDCAKDKNVWVGASIGPIPDMSTEEVVQDEDEVLEEYYFIVDTFLNEGAQLFVFETFSDTEYINLVSKYIKRKCKYAEIIAQFSVNNYGYTKKGISAKRILNEVRLIEGLTAYGFNCGIGVGHLYNVMRSLELQDENIVAIPNAGYPEIIYDRTIYRENAEYFADTMMEIKDLGVRIIGGCCGTTPKHIKYIVKKLNGNYSIPHRINISDKKEKIIKKRQKNKFYNKLKNNEFVIAVELDPPFNGDVDKIMEGANILKAVGVDIITIADSPLGRPRADSIIISNKIFKEVGIEVMPHICCRDKNIIALKSMILAAHIEGIRNTLLVTGDPIPSSERSEIKSVFNMNSIKLMNLVKELNYEIDDQMVYGGALNPNLSNVKKIIERIERKKEAGASYLLTQPVYNDQGIENLKMIKDNVDIKILGGILPLVNYKNAQFLRNEMPGIDVPDDICDRFDIEMSREQAEKIGVDISVDIANKMKNIVDGFYFMTPFNRATMIAKIIKKIK